MKRILIPTDLSPHTEAVLGRVQAHYPQAEVRLLCISQAYQLLNLTTASPHGGGMYCPMPSFVQEVEANERKKLQTLAAQFGVQAELRHGGLLENIRQVARGWPADLIVLHKLPSRHAWLWSASVSQSLLREPPCEVLLLHLPKGAMDWHLDPRPHTSPPDPTTRPIP